MGRDANVGASFDGPNRSVLKLSMHNDTSNSPQQTKPVVGARRREFYWTTILFLVCLVAVCTIDNFLKKPGQAEWETLWPMVLAVCICYAGSIACVMLNTAAFERKNPLGSLLLGMTIRTTVVIGAVLVATATKWANHNLFSMTLVGCYFSYLALESSLSIKRIHSRI